MTTFGRCLVLLAALGIGSTLATAGEPEVKPKFILRGQGTYVRSVAFSPDNKMLVSSGNDAGIWLYDVVGGKTIRELCRVNTTTGCGLTFSPDSKMVAAANPSFCTLCPIAADSASVTLPKPMRLGKVWSTSAMPLPFCSWLGPIFSPDGKLLAYRLYTGGEKPPKVIPPENRVEKPADLWKIYAYWDVGARETVKLQAPTWLASAYSKFNVEAIKTRIGIKLLLNSVVAISHDNVLLATTHGQGFGPLDVWDLIAGKKVARLPVGKDGDIALAFSPDRTMLAAGGRDGLIRIWDVTLLTRKTE